MEGGCGYGRAFKASACEQAEAGKVWTSLKTRLGNPFWLEPSGEVARDEDGVAAGGQGTSGTHQVLSCLSPGRMETALPGMLLLWSSFSSQQKCHLLSK